MVNSVLQPRSIKCPNCKRKVVTIAEERVHYKDSSVHYSDGRIEVKCPHCAYIFLAVGN